MRVSKWDLVLVGDDLRQGGLAGAGRAPEDDGREQPVGLDGAAQELARADDVLLADVLVQGARAHAGGQRGFGFHAFLHGVVEEVGHGVIVPFEEWEVLNHEGTRREKRRGIREQGTGNREQGTGIRDSTCREQASFLEKKKSKRMALPPYAGDFEAIFGNDAHIWG